MSARKTIADSKKAFNKAFPYVIPAIYRKVTDELLVELNLLSHQKEFQTDNLFALGLTDFFKDFTNGYRPKEHLEELFDAICRSNSLDPRELISMSKVLEEEATQIDYKQIKNCSKIEDLKNLLEKSNLGDFKTKNVHYSKLHCIGIVKLINASKGATKEINIDLVKQFGEILGFSVSRIDKDVTLYKSNLERVEQALELISESIKREKKKQEERLKIKND